MVCFQVLRWLRENTSTPFLKRHGVAPVEGQSLAAAAKKSRLEDLLAVYDKAACDLSCLVVRRSEATIAAEREEDRREREEEERQFGLGKAQDPDAAGDADGGGMHHGCIWRDQSAGDKTLVSKR